MFRTHITKVMMAGGVLLLPLADTAAETPAQPAATPAAAPVANGAGERAPDAAHGPATHGSPATAQATTTHAGTQAPAADTSAGTSPNAAASTAEASPTADTTASTANASPDTAAAPQPQLTADELSFNIERRQMTASGNATLQNGDTVIQADEVLLDRRSALVMAEGDIVVTDGPFRFLTPDLTYGYEAGTIGTANFRMGAHPLRVKGQSLGGSTEDLTLRNTALYLNEPDFASLNLHAGKARLVNRNQLELEDVTFRLGSVPFFYLPSYSVGLAQDTPVDFSFRIGYNKSLGAFAQTQTLIRIWEELRLGANLDGYTARGVLAGPAGSYSGKWGDGSFIDTSFTSGYINDNGGAGKLGLDSLGRPIDRNRFFADWKLIGGIENRVDLTGTLNWWSDSEVTRDYRDDIFRHNQTPDNFFEATYRGENYLIGSFVRFRPNAWEQNVERLPDVSFNLTPTEILETGIYQRLDASYAHLEGNDPYGVNPGLRSNRLNAYYNLSRTFTAGDWFSFTPVGGVMVTHYADTTPGSGQSSYTRVLGEVGFDAQMLANGRWDLKDEIWGINGLRHIMRPIVQYRYIPSAQAGDTLIPQLDRQDPFQTYLDPIGLADRRSIDNLYAQSTLRIGLENVLQTRSAQSYGSRQLVELNLYQQFNFIRQPEIPASYNYTAKPRQNSLSDFYTELNVTPTDWLKSTVFTRIDPNNFQMRQISTRTRVIDSDRWSAYVGNDYLEDAPGSMINQYVFGGAYRLNDRNQLSADWRVDGSLSEVTEQYYGWQTMLGKSWLVTTQVGYLNGTDRNNHFQFRIRADLKLF